MQPYETVILEGASVTVTSEPPTFEDGRFTPGFMHVRIGHVGFSLTNETAEELRIAIAKAQPTFRRNGLGA